MKKYYEPERVKKIVGFEAIPEEVRIEYLRPGEILSIQESFPVAYQPVGTLEWHGRQNPIGCDAIKAGRLCVEAARLTGGVVMPAIFFATDAYRDIGRGTGYGMDAAAGFELPGSFYPIPEELLKKFLINACKNYLARGFKLVALVSGHNAIRQQYALDEVCYAMKTDEGAEPVCATMEYAVLERGDPRRHSDHAGFYETSMMMLMTDRVNMSANDGKELPELAVNTGRPLAEANAAEGEIYFKLQVDGMVRFVNEKYKNLLGSV